jgi:hypothetical protein
VFSGCSVAPGGPDHSVPASVLPRPSSS